MGEAKFAGHSGADLLVWNISACHFLISLSPKFSGNAGWGGGVLWVANAAIDVTPSHLPCLAWHGVMRTCPLVAARGSFPFAPTSLSRLPLLTLRVLLSP